MHKPIDKLPLHFYTRTDVVEVAQDLLGKKLITQINGITTSGIIVETEAYSQTEKACHAYRGQTKRNAAMFQQGGIAYVYLCYGIHHLFNIVVGDAGVGDAVLIRAIEPLDGIEAMLQRRNMEKTAPRVTAGPGSLSQALGINTSLDTTPLTGDTIWLEDAPSIQDSRIIKSPRVGVHYAGADALLPWRFRVKDNPFTSPAK